MCVFCLRQQKIYNLTELGNQTDNQSGLFIYLTDAQLHCSKRMPKFTLQFTLKCSYMFRSYNHHQGAEVRALLKLYSIIMYYILY